MKKWNQSTIAESKWPKDPKHKHRNKMGKTRTQTQENNQTFLVSNRKKTPVQPKLTTETKWEKKNKKIIDHWTTHQHLRNPNNWKNL